MVHKKEKQRRIPSGRDVAINFIRNWEYRSAVFNAYIYTQLRKHKHNMSRTMTMTSWIDLLDDFFSLFIIPWPIVFESSIVRRLSRDVVR